MNFKTIYLLCCLAILLTVSCRTVAVENKDSSDYVALIDGDTLYGKVDYFKKNNQYGGPTFNRKLWLKQTNGKKRRFKYRDVAAFKLDNDVYKGYLLTKKTKLLNFSSKLTSRYILDKDGDIYFLREQHKGKLSYYCLDFYDEDNNNLWTARLIKKEEDNFFIRADGGPFLGLKRKALINYFSDCPDIQKKIEQEHFKYTFQIVDYYNENCGVNINP